MAIQTALVASALISAGTAVYAAANKPKISQPKQPSKVDTGALVAQASQKTLEDTDVSKAKTLSKKAKQGTKQFQVDLKQLPKTGTNVSPSAGKSVNV